MEKTFEFFNTPIEQTEDNNSKYGMRFSYRFESRDIVGNVIYISRRNRFFSSAGQSAGRVTHLQPFPVYDYRINTVNNFSRIYQYQYVSKDIFADTLEELYQKAIVEDLLESVSFFREYFNGKVNFYTYNRTYHNAFCANPITFLMRGKFKTPELLWPLVNNSITVFNNLPNLVMKGRTKVYRKFKKEMETYLNGRNSIFAGSRYNNLRLYVNVPAVIEFLPIIENMEIYKEILQFIFLGTPVDFNSLPKMDINFAPKFQNLENR